MGTKPLIYLLVMSVILALFAVFFYLVFRSDVRLSAQASTDTESISNSQETSPLINMGGKIDETEIQKVAEKVSDKAKQTGRLESGEEKTIELQTDSTGETTFFLSWTGESKPSFSLVSPNQVEITPSFAAANPGNVQYRDGSIDTSSQPYQIYMLTSGQPGTWKIKLVGGASPVTFQAFATQQTACILQAELDKTRYQAGENAVITAKITNQASDSGTTVIAKVTAPDGAQTEITLLEQPKGFYTGSYIIPNAPGFLIIDIHASGLDQGAAYNLSKNMVSIIMLNDPSLTGAYSEMAVNQGSNGQFEKLAYDVEVDVINGGPFTFTAKLYAGEQLITNAYANVDLAPGKQTVRLLFDGQSIQQAGLDGPYTIKNLDITSTKLGVGIGGSKSVLQTKPYLHTQFGPAPANSHLGKTNPKNQEKDLSTNPKLEWYTNMDIVSYEYCYDTKNNNICDTNWISTEAAQTSITLYNLQAKTTYYWQIQSVGTNGMRQADGSLWWSFTTEPPAEPLGKKNPANNAINQSIFVILQWSGSTDIGADEYCYDTIDNDSCDTEWVGMSQLRLGLAYNTTYYWQVRSINNSQGTTYADDGIWWSFTTEPAPSAMFNIPGFQSKNTNPFEPATISWKNGTRIIGYTTNNVIIYTGATIFANQAPNKTCNWPIQAVNDSGNAPAYS